MRNALLLTLTAALLAGCTSHAPQQTPPQTPPPPRAQTLDFSGFEGQKAALTTAGLRVFGKNATLAQDLEPEYIAVAPDGKTAWVSLQENNALAILDLEARRVRQIVPLGFKDHSLPGQGLDASDKDAQANIRNWPVLGMYMPDGIAAFSVGGQTYLVSANEGDAREYDGLEEETRVSRLRLDPTAFPNAAELQKETQLGRLNVTNTLGDTDGDGDFDRLYAFGARSLSVWDASGRLLADTGDLLERKMAELLPAHFNADHGSNTLDNRSDNKGPEPEGVTVGVVGGKTLAFLGLERASGIVVLDVSDPRAPKFVQYFNPRDFTQAPESGNAGDLGPEGLLFVPATDSPNGQPMLVVGNEVSGSTTLYRVQDSGQLSMLGRYQVSPFAFDEGAAEIPAYDAGSRRVFVVNGATGGLDVLDVSDPTRPTLVKSLSLAAYGGSANSVAARGGVIAVAVQNDADKQANGRVVFFDKDGRELGQEGVGALPDMLTFTPDGKTVLVANEGEPSSDYTRDPVGSVTLLDVAQIIGK
ncbi:hypothetical protein HNR42_002493 [Deinobacterium chartae]|uniref:Choice-of-anchor I domain-containing protein n=1 Tax=Deinobacterium chartae TaxID=521158 RepID=A0A841I080_9DEIO|nr:choice-of-anchor I family protein [Deinobacterium chartae]MBB6099057.1 hypothetical protein [Deinobacterium chartae]